jgi:hypothetical protein
LIKLCYNIGDYQAIVGEIVDDSGIEKKLHHILGMINTIWVLSVDKLSVYPRIM